MPPRCIPPQMASKYTGIPMDFATGSLSLNISLLWCRLKLQPRRHTRYTHFNGQHLRSLFVLAVSCRGDDNAATFSYWRSHATYDTRFYRNNTSRHGRLWYLFSMMRPVDELSWDDWLVMTSAAASCNARRFLGFLSTPHISCLSIFSKTICLIRYF